MSIGSDNRTDEVTRRIAPSWAAFGKLHGLFKLHISVSLERKAYPSRLASCVRLWGLDVNADKSDSE